MNAAEKFKVTIDFIEELIQDEEKRSSDIGEIVAKKNGRSPRDMSTIFGYLTDMAPSDYITQRKLNAAYVDLVVNGNGIAHAVGIAGYNDQSAFSKAFKRQFDMTPREAQKRKDLTLITPPITWDDLSGGRTSETNVTEEKPGVGNLIFGVSEVSFEKIEKVLELEAFYGFKRMFSKYAFKLSESSGKSLEDCFSYAESLREFCGDFDKGFEDNLSPDERLQECGDDKNYQELFFSRGISVEMSWYLLECQLINKEEIMSCDPKAIVYYPGFEEGVEISFSYFVRAYNYYVEHFDIDRTEESFERYLDYITAGYPIEVSFDIIFGSAATEDAITTGSIFESVDDMDLDLAEEERYLAIEREAEEESRWYGIRLDEDLYYDSENEAYDQYDKEDMDEW